MENVKKEIKENIDKILKMDLAILYPDYPNVQLWNNLDNTGLKNFVKLVQEDLRILSSDISALNQIPPHQLTVLRDQTGRFIKLHETCVQQIQNIDTSQLVTQHHNALNHLNTINDTLRNLGLKLEIRLIEMLKENIPNLKQASMVAKDLLGAAEEIKESIGQARAWLDVRRDAHGQTITDQAKAFYNMASSHRMFWGWGSTTWSLNVLTWPHKLFRGFLGTGLWMVSVLIFASVTAFVTYFFITKEAVGSGIDVGQALLRITSLVVPAYLTLFSANQFLYHRRMHDNYMFKYSSLNTMNNLIATHKEGGDKILEKGLDVLFSEPKTKESSGKYDTQLVNELIKMLRDQTRN